MPSSLKSIALIGSYLPRQCGIATFTTDVAAAILDNDPNIDCSIVAMNDRPEGYEYSSTVRFQIRQDRLSEYGTPPDFSICGIQMSSVCNTNTAYLAVNGAASSLSLYKTSRFR